MPAGAPTRNPNDISQLLGWGRRLENEHGHATAKAILSEYYSQRDGLSKAVGQGLAEDTLAGNASTLQSILKDDMAGLAEQEYGDNEDIDIECDCEQGAGECECEVEHKAEEPGPDQDSDDEDEEDAEDEGEGDHVSKSPARFIEKADNGDFVIYGPASVDIVDKEDDVVSKEALESALPNILKRGNLSLEHTDIQPGEIVEKYEADGGEVYKTEVREVTKDDLDEFPKLEKAGAEPGDHALFLTAKLYDDTSFSEEAKEKIEKGELGALSISGQATDETTEKNCDGFTCKLVNVVKDLDGSAVTLCEDGMNAGASSKVVSKAGDPDDADEDRDDVPDTDHDLAPNEGQPEDDNEAVNKEESPEELEENTEDDPDDADDVPEALEKAMRRVDKLLGTNDERSELEKRIDKLAKETPPEADHGKKEERGLSIGTPAYPRGSRTHGDISEDAAQSAEKGYNELADHPQNSDRLEDAPGQLPTVDEGSRQAGWFQRAEEINETLEALAKDLDPDRDDDGLPDASGPVVDECPEHGPECPMTCPNAEKDDMEDSETVPDEEELMKPAPEGVDEDKYDRCVEQVKEEDTAENAHAVCAEQLKKVDDMLKEWQSDGYTASGNLRAINTETGERRYGDEAAQALTGEEVEPGAGGELTPEESFAEEVESLRGDLDASEEVQSQTYEAIENEVEDPIQALDVGEAVGMWLSGDNQGWDVAMDEAFGDKREEATRHVQGAATSYAIGDETEFNHHVSELAGLTKSTPRHKIRETDHPTGHVQDVELHKLAMADTGFANIYQFKCPTCVKIHNREYANAKSYFKAVQRGLQTGRLPYAGPHPDDRHRLRNEYDYFRQELLMAEE